MKRILYIGGFEMPDKNAAAQRVMANAMLLREMGFKISFIGPTKDRTKAISQFNGFNFNYIDYPSDLLSWMKYITTFVEADEILKYEPDYVVLYNFPSIASLKVMSICHKCKIKVIHDITEWETTNGWSVRNLVHKADIALRMRYCMKKMDGVIAISRYLYDYYKAYTNTILVPPTVDLNDTMFCRDRTLSASDRITKLVYAGCVVKSTSKDRLDLIIKEVNNFPNLQLDIVGVTKEQFRSVFGYDTFINDNVIFHGRVPHKEAVKYVCEADFQLLIRDHSLKNTAGFPTKFVESISCCTPLIATNTSNICDYFQDEVNGFFVTEERPLDVILKTISHISVDEKVRMKVACRNITEFDYRNYAKEFSKIFK